MYNYENSFFFIKYSTVLIIYFNVIMLKFLLTLSRILSKNILSKRFKRLFALIIFLSLN